MKSDKVEYIRRYNALQQMVAAGDITDLVIHPHWAIVVSDVHVCVVEADFSYTNCNRKTKIAEFIKAPNSAAHAIKKKLLKACYGIESEEVKA